MTRHVIVAVCLILGAISSRGEGVRVFIAPQTISIPYSGKVTFDVYWANTGFDVRRIPPAGVYIFGYSSLGTAYSYAGSHAALDYHTSPERPIAPGAIIHDRITVDIGVHPKAPLTQVYAKFQRRGWSPDFLSNTVVLR